MVIAGLIEINQHDQKWRCTEEPSTEVYRCKIYRGLDNTSPHISWYGKSTIINELIVFGCEIYPITTSL